MARLDFQPNRVNAAKRPVAPSRPAGGFPLSICMIVKNEESNLPELLESLRPLDAELVIVDTGSTDRTIEIARESGARVVEWAWRGDFAMARNISLDHATRPWVLWMDADDRLPEKSVEELRTLVAGRPDRAYTFLVKNTTNGGASGSEFSQLRLFPNHPRIRFTGAVHEQVYPALTALGIPFEYHPLVVHHTGYIDKDVIRSKQARNIEILKREIKLRPDEAMRWFQLGSAHSDLDELVEAEECLRRAMMLIGKGDPDHHLASIIPSYVAVLRTKLDNWTGAHDVLLELADPDPATWHPNQIAIAAQIWLRAVSPEAATEWFDKAYTPPQAKALLPVDPKMTSLLPLQNLAEYWRGVGKEPLGTEFLLLVKQVLMDSFPPRRSIPDAYLRHGLPARAAELYAWCIEKDGEEPGVWAGIVRATAMAGDPESAAGFLDAGRARWPADRELLGLAQGAG